MAARGCQNAVIYRPMYKSLIITAGVFIAINLAWIWCMMDIKKDFQNQIEENRDWMRMQDRALLRDREVLTGLLESDDYPLSRGLVFLNPDGDSVPITDILQGVPRLVLYLADNHCDSCVEQILFTFQKLKPLPGMSKLLVFYSTVNLSSSKWKKYVHMLAAIGFYRILMEKLTMPLAKSGVPFLFISDSTLKVQTPMLIFPDAEESVSDFINLKFTKLIHKNLSE